MIYIQRSISIPRGEPKIVKTRQFKQYNTNNFKADIFTHLNDEIFLNSTLDPNVMWEKWKTRFLTVADFHAPPITKRVRSQYAPWIPNNIRQVMRQIDYLKKKAVKTGSKQFHDAYRRTRIDLNRLIKNTKAEYFMNTLNECENNPKEMWKAVNKLTNKSSNTTVISEIHKSR
jgi:hypothetical protein